MEKRIPFRDVYFTGMVRDKQGRKMSKSLGNSPDLLELIEKYGADAVRFGILISSPAGNDLLFDEAALEQGRNFNNKLWNALKLVKGWESRLQQTDPNTTAPPFAVTWLDNRLQEVRATLEQLFAEFRLSEALKTLYSLIWDDFCSWYLEWVKPGFEQPIDAGVYQRTIAFFEQLVQLLHPFMPFITEELYHLLGERTGDLCVLPYTATRAADLQVLEQGALLKETITAIRDARNKAQLKPKELIHLHIQSDAESTYKAIMDILSKQVNAPTILFTKEIVPATLVIAFGKHKFYIGTEQAVDAGKQKEEMQKELKYLIGFRESIDRKLNNEKFVQNARSEVVDLERKKRADAEEKIKVLQESLSGSE
jgi:valyl-tRNA synthetase